LLYKLQINHKKFNLWLGFIKLRHRLIKLRRSFINLRHGFKKMGDDMIKNKSQKTSFSFLIYSFFNHFPLKNSVFLDKIDLFFNYFI